MIRPRKTRLAAARAFLRQEKRRENNTISGVGSTIQATRRVRALLNRLILNHRVQSLVNVPCGDGRWIAPIAGRVDYLGLDLVPEVVERSHGDCRVLDLVTEVPPAADVILCRDLLQHLTTDEALACVRNLQAAAPQLLLITSHDVPRNRDLMPRADGWGFRPLNLTLPPFPAIKLAPRLSVVERGKKRLLLIPLGS